MNWKLRAFSLRTMATVPLGCSLYQLLQRHFGLHCDAKFLLGRLRKQASLAKRALEGGGRLEGAHVVELGTGWVPVAPIGFWICGARRIDTYDLNRHFLLPILRRALRMMVQIDRDELIQIWRDVARPEAVLAKLSEIESELERPLALLERAGIHYHAPADAGATKLADGSVDIHYSASVLEHMPREAIVRCLKEARRVLRPETGVAIHHVDPSDHFAHFDPSISKINFLQFDEAAWRRYAGNRLAYHNRLREPDYRQILDEAGHEIIDSSSRVDPRSLELLRHSDFPLDERFEGLDPESLCRQDLLYVGKSRPEG